MSSGVVAIEKELSCEELRNDLPCISIGAISGSSEKLNIGPDREELTKASILESELAILSKLFKLPAELRALTLIKSSIFLKPCC